MGLAWGWEKHTRAKTHTEPTHLGKVAAALNITDHWQEKWKNPGEPPGTLPETPSPPLLNLSQTRPLAVPSQVRFSRARRQGLRQAEYQELG